MDGLRSSLKYEALKFSVNSTCAQDSERLLNAHGPTVDMAEYVSMERFSLKNGHGNFQLITPVHGSERLLKVDGDEK